MLWTQTLVPVPALFDLGQLISIPPLTPLENEGDVGWGEQAEHLVYPRSSIPVSYPEH